MPEHWIVVWRSTGEWCQDCGLRGTENDVGRRYVPELGGFTTVGGRTYEPSLDDVGLPRRHSYLGFHLTLDCMGCHGTGRAATQYRFEAGSMFSLLTAKQKMVMSYRLGFADGKPWKQTELASLLGISQPAVHRLERRAKTKINQKVVNTLGLPAEGGYISLYRGETVQPSPQSGSSAVLKELKGLRRDVATLMHKADMDELRWQDLLTRHSRGDLEDEPHNARE